MSDDRRSSGPVIGIDLGTTNSALAEADESAARPALVAIPQVVASREVSARRVLPSFLYFPTTEERESGSMALPWNPNPEVVIGVFARDHGALVPTRQIWSAKSWLSNSSVDRRAALLPWVAGSEPGLEDAPRLSPVDASARVLAHIRDAWNHSRGRHPALRLEQCDIVLTVPASFDEEARELTLEAANAVGFAHLVLLEEPLAAVYAWIASHPRQLPRMLSDGQLLLVCDVGGGTTDFSLIRATTERGRIAFERAAIGEHLLLGGDNLDLALAALVERKLADEYGPTRVGLTERQILRRECSGAKERLFTEGADRVAIMVLGSGRKVVGGAATAELTRSEALATLDDFLPRVQGDARPERRLRRGLRELGLPYESDPAITRHLAAFLARAARVTGEQPAGSDMVAPDAVLFNGGFFVPPIARERILETLESWFGRRPVVLTNDAPEAAVAIGAAFYATLRRDRAAAARLLIRAGSARAYYVAVQTPESDETGGHTGPPGPPAPTAVCILPRGTQEGTRVALEREFTVIANQPAAFSLLSSVDRDDSLNEIVRVSTEDDLHRHAPLVTALRYGRRSRKIPLKVRLEVTFTELGTLELWCESPDTGHRWRLQFNLRSEESRGTGETPDTDGAAPDEVIVSDEALRVAEKLIVETFESSGGAAEMDALVGDLERTLGHGKDAWPLLAIRHLADALLRIADRRTTSPRHEARWLNLVGFCMRPGFGTALDAWRTGQLRQVYSGGVAHPKDIQCQVEWLILWQRVSAGFSAGQQRDLAGRLVSLLGVGARKRPHLNSQMVREAWRLLAGLERLDQPQRVRFGDELMTRIRREPENAGLLWAIGRMGARIPLYGPFNSVVPARVAERWIEDLFTIDSRGKGLGSIVQIGARCDDPVRDISDEARAAAIVRLEQSGAAEESWLPLRHFVPVDPLRGATVFGESLPLGLRLERESGSQGETTLPDTG